MPRLRERGKNTSASEVTGIDRSGLWILVHDTEYFIPFADYPMLANARINELYDMKAIAPGQLRWDSLDCDIEVAALKSPEGFPLIYK